MKSKHFEFLFHPIKLVKGLALLSIFTIYFVNQSSLANTEITTDIVSIKYIHGWKDNNGDILGAIQFKLSPGWKTYWRNPGPFGIKPTFDWTNSQNVRKVKLSWPTPKIFQQYDVKVIGYQNVLTIPIKIIKMFPLQHASLSINLEFGVCADICLLKTAKISTPLEFQTSQENFDLIATALKEVPSKTTGKVFFSSKCSIDINDGDLSIEYLIHLSKVPKSKPEMIIEYAFSDDYTENLTVKLEGKKLSVKTSLQNIYSNHKVIERNRLTALLIIEDSGFVITGCD